MGLSRSEFCLAGQADRERNDCMYCVCREHVEQAIDKFVDEYEDAPDLINLQTTAFTEWEPPSHCEWCGNWVEILVM